ncbi:ATP-dependent RNA helicase DRS1 [Diplogelasinospora grovesii]|uniref:ATP-dependent RNA helicase DRS1 n=1 Tax=Diplogelasinospora grovesii TaxID=303347 RepID=A0AAN6NCQ9_9PEZI|nr:ATP-dependent RNA helicase DRS1 [Diplogelasinospora grovesii]
MAPSAQKRKTLDDDFVYTVSDNEADVIEEELSLPAAVAAPPPKKKAKTAAANNKKELKKKNKNKNKKGKGKKGKGGDVEDEEEEGVDGEGEGIWGQKDEDDGAMDSDFEFVNEGGNAFGGDDLEVEFDGAWGFEGAKKGMVNGGGVGGDKKGVDIDEIIRRRREKHDRRLVNETNREKNQEKKKNRDEGDEEGGGGEGEEEGEEEGGEGVDLDDGDDEVLAEDAFGMAVGSDVEEEDQEKMGEDGDEEGDASDNDSVATPVHHPDDDDEDEDDEEEDEEEQAKAREFFAPEEVEDKSAKGKKDTSSFQGMSLSRPILRGLTSVGFTKPTPIQAKAIPIALMGKDLVGGAVTGSGKTAAFVVPILERLLYRPKKVPTSRVVILTPTRELAIQCHAVAVKLASHTDIKFCLAVGGLSLKVQEAELRLRPDVIIATPGRFIDHMRNSASFAVETVEILVLDEADRMLEDGFADELNEILTTIPKSRQTMLFSATMTSSVDKLIRVGMDKPVRIMVDSKKKTVGTLVQEFVRLRPGREEKRMGYLVHICKTLYTERVIIFFRQKKIAHRTRIIFGLLGLSCAELHGSMNQAQRIASVEDFRDGKVSYLLATDLASRGLDIKGVDTVINYEAPQTLEIYVHRVGRTARAGRTGVAITLAAEPDRKVVKAAVRAGKAQGAKIISRVIEPAEADKWQAQVDEMDDEIDEIMREEKEEKQLAQAEMQVKKGENMIKHEEEINARPKRTWFETQRDKQQAKEAGRAELNGVREKMKKKGAGKLSNKDKKKLDSKMERAAGADHAWKKGRAERDGKGAVLNLKKEKKVKSKGPGATNLAPFRRFPQPHPHNRSSLLRYLFPPSVRERYRERLLDFRLETLPHYKRRLQSRIYRFLVERQRKRRSGTRLVDLVRRHGGRILLGPEPRQPTRPQRFLRQKKDKDAHASARPPTKDGTYYGSGGAGVPVGGIGGGDGSADGPSQERGSRRRRLAAMAGSVYRAGVAAASELKEQYNNTRTRGAEIPEHHMSIPGAFPQVSIITKGDEQMVLFPSYAKRHIKESGRLSHPSQAVSAYQTGMDDEEYWRHEWAKMEDEKAVVDVDVRGWIYMPSERPMTRRNRMLIGLARRLSGIPAPTTQPEQLSTGSMHEEHEQMREEKKIAKEAQKIERRGQNEKEVATRGGYSEAPREDYDSDSEADTPNMRTYSGSRTPMSAPGSPTLGPSKTWAQPSEMTEAELTVANANLMARIGPFMTTPLVQLPITIFFYNDEQSVSRTVETNDAGHFSIRAALDFVPTHVRVLANENISATEPVQVIERYGVSLISDIDDTIKHSNISMGAREIFRNTFIRELTDLTVEGVKEWYTTMHEMGVKLHYCSNSPWQLFPVLATFFLTAGLPPGSIHLKQYSGMLQGIFEPVAERKKGTLDKILRDFPERKFILVGDSGEADLEVYTELAVASPGRILAVFIRDVTTPDQTGYFDSAFRDNAGRRSRHGSTRIRFEDQSEERDRPVLPPRIRTAPSSTSEGPIMGTLIDLTDEPEPIDPKDLTRAKSNSASAVDLLSRKPPPPRPAKPVALRSAPSDGGGVGLGISSSAPASTSSTPTPPNPRVRKPSGPSSGAAAYNSHPLAQMQNSSDQTSVGSSASSTNNNSKSAPPPPPPRRRGTPSSLLSLSPRLLAQHGRRSSSNADIGDLDPLPGAAFPGGSTQAVAAVATLATANASPPGTGTATPTGAASPISKKVDLWRRRLARAHEQLDQQGVVLYTWRRGEDVIAEAEGIVKEALKELEQQNRHELGQAQAQGQGSGKGLAGKGLAGKR